MPRGKKKIPNRVLRVLDTRRAANAAKSELLAAVRTGTLTDEERDYFDVIKEVSGDAKNAKPRKEHPSPEPLEAKRNGDQIASTI